MRRAQPDDVQDPAPDLDWPTDQPRKRRMRNVIIAIVVLQILALCGWALVGDKPDPNAYAFLQTQTDGKTPVAYDPCETIHYVVRQTGSPAGGQRLITSAVERVAKATGLRFVYDGPTSESPVTRREFGIVPEDGWPPVLIGWVTPEENPELAGDIAGSGGSSSRALDQSARIYVTGTVDLDAGRMRELVTTARGKRQAKAVILHELGHLVGLDHVNDKQQLMHPQSQPGVDDFSAGDLTGLAALGKGPCVPEVSRP